MIPRFIVRNITTETLTVLKSIGYQCRENPVPTDVLIIGGSITQAPSVGKNPLTVNLDLVKANGNGAIINQATMHWNWLIEITAGRIRKAEVHFNGAIKEIEVTKLGVLIDGFVVPIVEFIRLAKYLKHETTECPQIATHKPVPAKVAGKLTIGCADYSLADFDKIMAAYNSLTKP